LFYSDRHWTIVIPPELQNVLFFAKCPPLEHMGNDQKCHHLNEVYREDYGSNPVFHTLQPFHPFNGSKHGRTYFELQVVHMGEWISVGIAQHGFSNNKSSVGIVGAVADDDCKNYGIFSDISTLEGYDCGSPTQLAAMREQCNIQSGSVIGIETIDEDYEQVEEEPFYNRTAIIRVNGNILVEFKYYEDTPFWPFVGLGAFTRVKISSKGIMPISL